MFERFSRQAWPAAFIVICVLLLCSPSVHAQKVQTFERNVGYQIKKTWRPTIFQGGHRKHDYYEGWYFKSVADDGSLSFALIPGIALGEHSHAFIQYIDGKTAETRWYEFPADAFSYSQRKFEVRIADNYFSSDSLHVNVGEGESRLAVDLHFRDLHPWKVKAFSPGIMGWYRFVPGMETCHGLVSLDHRVAGAIQVGESAPQTFAGRGYIEKDWGSSFPRSYIWMQSNHFGSEKASFMCSIATIPYLGKFFRGFLGFFWYEGKCYRFATYTHAQIDVLELTDNSLSFMIIEEKWTLFVKAKRRSSGELKAPQKGEMERRISESIEAQISLRLVDKLGNEIFAGIGTDAGLEIVGQLDDLRQ